LKAAAFAHLSGLAEFPLLHHVPQGLSAFHHDKTVRLLDHHPKYGHGRTQFVLGKGVIPGSGLVFHHRHGAQRFVALFQLTARTLGFGSTRRAGRYRPSPAQLGVRTRTGVRDPGTENEQHGEHHRGTSQPMQLHRKRVLSHFRLPLGKTEDFGVPFRIMPPNNDDY
jgi:hypothetical protein